ncbi:MAG: Fe-S oxidoreductase [Anaerocolumna sp.]|jgi:radical SAM superfamily enzyme YgiQ (UPF0313 family)|nr:Fe-S oxidoreductase [Anaerocolumna sp.]
MKQVLLINPQPVVLKDIFAESIMYHNPPLGLGYLASAIRKKGFTVDLCDIGPERMLITDLLKKIEENQVKVVGISSFIANHGNGIRIAKHIKEKLPYIKIVMGGPQASFIPEEVLKSGCIDVVSLFEGEVTLPEIIDAFINDKPLDDITGICFIKDGEFVKTAPRTVIENIDHIDFPAWDLIKIDKYVQPGIILTGRGCPYKCIFCAASVVSGARYRIRSTKNVVDEIEYLHNVYNLKNFFFADDTFTADENHCIDICREIRRRGLKIKWEAEARANTVNDRVVSEMAKAGCMHVQIGAESGDNNILKTIGKNITTKTIEKAVKTFLAHGISVVCSFIIGNPDDTKETISKTIEFSLKLKNLAPNKYCSLKYALLTPLPGTPVYTDREKLGVKLITSNWDKFTFYDPIIETKHLTKRDLQNEYARAWTSYTAGRLVVDEQNNLVNMNQ